MKNKHVFSRDEKRCIAHAIDHLKSNKIADDGYQGYGGWYSGNRAQFVARHKKAIKTLSRFMEE